MNENKHHSWIHVYNSSLKNVTMQVKEADTGHKLPENSVTNQSAWWRLHAGIISVDIPRYMLQVVQPYYTKGGRNVDLQTKFY